LGTISPKPPPFYAKGGKSMPCERNITPPIADFGERDSVCDVDDLLHPARAFKHPSNVVDDPDLTLNEKRAILASWASDACAIEAAPSLRAVPGGTQPVRFDDVMDALCDLEQIPLDFTRSRHV
jgi:hypothetical protein